MDATIQSSINSTVQTLVDAIQSSLSRPIYLQFSKSTRGDFVIKQVCFLSVDELAELAHVERRTVYAWVERGAEIGLKFYKPPGSRGILFELNETLDWIKGNGGE
ncbi:MAG TPA: helix-turn-helix domain-containing protein [Blastocatellia bacterium]|nr:helix-turn-helix domain-containing protein [Blastocatellia bacterium]